MINSRYLYHGTKTKYVDSIVRSGLVPRKPGKKGNFPTLISRLGHVYLTDAYGLTYAEMVSDKKGRQTFAVIEVGTSNLSLGKFCPDEDWVAERLKVEGYERIPKNIGTVNLTRWARDIPEFNNPELASHSLEERGTLSYDGAIPAEAINAVAILNMDAIVRLTMHGHDPVLSSMNYGILGGKYRGWMQWLFEHPVTETSLFSGEVFEYPEDRTGIELIRTR